MMTQTLAIFADAYHQLQSRKLFWLVLVLSGLVVVIFGLPSVRPDGLYILFWKVNSTLTSSVLAPSSLYKNLFLYLGINFWLTWAATILALVSTAGIFPDFLTGGAIDVMLAKPIGRVRLFLTKYLAGLFFVAFQVGLFCLASFLIIGIRGGVWEPGIFLAVPLVVIFFSYLFSICALLGMLTRSTVASLLLTILIWVVLFLLNQGDNLVINLTANAEIAVKRVEQRIEFQKEIDRIVATQPIPTDGEASAATQPSPPVGGDGRTAVAPTLQEQLDGAQGTLRTMMTIYNISKGIRSFMPKTNETIGLLQRTLITQADLPKPPADENETAGAPPPLIPPPPPGPGPGGFGGRRGGGFNNPAFRKQQEELEEHVRKLTQERSALWVLSTSLAFEVILVGLTAWYFQRRDF